ncbi:MAG: neocarzinostatin apoprotein domain-containing protein, partial [Acidimicrobiales bacterium]
MRRLATQRAVLLTGMSILATALISVVTWLMWSPGAIAQPLDDLIPVTAEPSTGLIDGQEVVIRGSGVPPNRLVAIVPCRSDTTDETGCDLAAIRLVPADEFGSFEDTITVYRRLSIGGVETDCAPNNCMIGVGQLP